MYRDDHDSAIADYQHCIAQVEAAEEGWPGQPPQAAMQARIQAVEHVKAIWEQQVLQ